MPPTKHWYQLSILQLLVAMAIVAVFITVNLKVRRVEVLGMWVAFPLETRNSRIETFPLAGHSQSWRQRQLVPPAVSEMIFDDVKLPHHRFRLDTSLEIFRWASLQYAVPSSWWESLLESLFNAHFPRPIPLNRPPSSRAIGLIALRQQVRVLPQHASGNAGWQLWLALRQG